MSTELFNAVAPGYDRANLVLSWGLDGLWRRSILGNLPKNTSLRVLDLATGTGDVAMLFPSG